jgi:hypothetical protein
MMVHGQYLYMRGLRTPEAAFPGYKQLRLEVLDLARDPFAPPVLSSVDLGVAPPVSLVPSRMLMAAPTFSSRNPPAPILTASWSSSTCGTPSRPASSAASTSLRDAGTAISRSAATCCT